MNDPFKIKLYSLYGKILNKQRMREAFSKVKANKGVGGIDNVSIEKYELNLEENLESLFLRLKAKEYKPSPVKRVNIPKKDGSKRPLGIPIIEDRIVQQILVDILTPTFENEVFHKCSCGFRIGYGMDKTIQLIDWYITKSNRFIYDCDIKGFFDNITHRKLMKILNKYISDGAVLDLIWQFLKSGYMEDGKILINEKGTPQGGVISPLLANIYLNELDWELHKANIKFVRYADDFLLFANNYEEILTAETKTKEVLNELGLEIQISKTKIVDFDKDDFDFVGFTFKSFRKRKDSEEEYYLIDISDKAKKDFKHKIKEKTNRKLTLNKEEWLNRVNPIIRGKTNYYLNVIKAILNNNKIKGYTSKSVIIIQQYLKKIDMYIRQRLRCAFIHKHPTIRKAFGYTIKWNIEFFAKIGLIPSYWLYYNKFENSTYTIEIYINNQMKKNREKHKKHIEKIGYENYWNKERVQKLKYVFARSSKLAFK